MDFMKIVSRCLLLTSSILLLVILTLGVSIVADIKAASQDMQELWSQVTLEDMRHTLNVVEKELDLKIIEAQLRAK